MMSKKLAGTTGLLIALAFLIGINIISNATMSGTKVDLTENKLYTLTEGSRNIVRGLDEPITLRLFYSEKLAAANPGLKNYATRVQDLLREYESESKGKLDFQIIDPQPFSEEEEMAVRAGIQGIPLPSNDRIYFGLQGVNTTEGKETIPFLTPEREQFLQYDVSEMIYNLANPEQRKLVILTNLPIDGDQDPMAAMMGQQSGGEPWIIYDELRQLYAVEVLKLNTTEIPEDTDVLMVVHPKDASAELKYAIDQYVLAGGKAIVFVDPLCEADQPPPNPQNPLQSMSAPKNSDLPELMEQWGLSLADGVVADRANAQQVMVGSRSQPEVVDYVLYLGLTEDDLNREEYVTSQLETINLITAGALEAEEKADLTHTWLLRTSEQTEMIETSKAQMFPQPKELLQDFKSQDKREWLAVKVSGNVQTAYPEGPPSTGEDEEEASIPEGHLSESAGKANVIVVSDCDILTDRTWVQVQNIFGSRLPFPMANNGQFVVNLVDHLSGSNDLISIRGRGKFRRPFTVVNEMVADAQDASSEKIKELQTELEETRQRLRELQSQAPEGGEAMITSSKLQKEIEQFRVKEVETQRELRRLERSLRQDVEKLGATLKFINIGLIPLLVGIIAVGLGAFRISRRRRR